MVPKPKPEKNVRTATKNAVIDMMSISIAKYHWPNNIDEAKLGVEAPNELQDNNRTRYDY